MAGEVPLQLLVDMKTDGPRSAPLSFPVMYTILNLIRLQRSTLPFVVKALQPLREKGYLTTFANGTLTVNQVTVVGTGNTPLDGVKALEPRDVFFDAPLTQLNDPSLNTTFDSTISPLASTDWETSVGWSGIGNISETQLGNLTQFVADAHALGIRARFWDTPGWPIFARNAIWQVLGSETRRHGCTSTTHGRHSPEG